MALDLQKRCSTSVNHSRMPSLLFFALFVDTTMSFLPRQEVHRVLQHRLVHNSLLDKYGDENGDGIDFANFNPLKQNQRPNKPTSSYSYRGTQISLRQTIMQDVATKLLDSIDDPQAMNSILEEYKEFLLQPLEDPNCVLEPGSIYSPGMSRNLRYDAYRSSMNQRLLACKNARVREVLEAMRDYVLSFEDTRAPNPNSP